MAGAILRGAWHSHSRHCCHAQHCCRQQHNCNPKLFLRQYPSVRPSKLPFQCNPFWRSAFNAASLVVANTVTQHQRGLQMLTAAAPRAPLPMEGRCRASPSAQATLQQPASIMLRDTGPSPVGRSSLQALRSMEEVQGLAKRCHKQLRGSKACSLAPRSQGGGSSRGSTPPLTPTLGRLSSSSPGTPSFESWRGGAGFSVVWSLACVDSSSILSKLLSTPSATPTLGRPCSSPGTRPAIPGAGERGRRPPPSAVSGLTHRFFTLVGALLCCYASGWQPPLRDSSTIWRLETRPSILFVSGRLASGLHTNKTWVFARTRTTVCDGREPKPLEMSHYGTWDVTPTKRSLTSPALSGPSSQRLGFHEPPAGLLPAMSEEAEVETSALQARAGSSFKTTIFFPA